MRTAIAEVIAYLSRHLTLRAGRPHRHRHAAAARRTARPGPPSPARRRRDRLDRAHRGAHHHHRLTPRQGGRAMKPPTVFLGEMTNPEVEAFLRTTRP